MKKRFLLGLAMGLFLAMSGSANALMLNGTDIGIVDQLIASSPLLTGENAELDWINATAGTNYTTIEKLQLGSGLNFQLVSGTIYAQDLAYNSDYFIIKVGSAEGSDDREFLFKNLVSADWAVIDLSLFGEGVTIKNIGKVSHLSEGVGSPVPEPATMMLFGAGLAGLAGMVRRKAE